MKNKKSKSKENIKKQNIILVASIIIIIICAIISITTIVKNNKNEQVEKNDSDAIHKEVLKDNIVDNLTISNAKITVNNDVSNFTAIVTNNTSDDYHFNTLYVTFTTNNITSKISALQDITLKPGEYETIILTLDSDVSETTKIDYTIERWRSNCYFFIFLKNYCIINIRRIGMVTIKDNKISPSKKVIDDIDIQIVYIPLVTKKGYKYVKTVSVGTYVYIGSIVGKSTVNELPLLSSVSGTVVGFENKYISNGNLVECIVIENDFKEKYFGNIGKKQDITKYSKEEFISLLKSCGISGMSGNDFPTYIKYETNNQIKYLIVNGVECEIYSSADNARMYKNPEEILECIDAIMEIMHIEKSYIAIKENNDIIIKKFLKYINTYPNIKIYPIQDAYPMGYERFLINEILGLSYDTITSKVGVITENVSTIYAIYEALKYHKPLVEKIVTISGDSLNNPANYKLKIGTNFREVAEKNHLYKDLKDTIKVAGGAMMGTPIKSDDLIITKDLTTILVLNNDNTKEMPCIKCGKCSEVCPMNLIPSLIIKKPKSFRELNINKCIECGLCSYICPSKIDVREHIKKIKEENNGRI